MEEIKKYESVVFETINDMLEVVQQDANIQTSNKSDGRLWKPYTRKTSNTLNEAEAMVKHFVQKREYYGGLVRECGSEDLRLVAERVNGGKARITRFLEDNELSRGLIESILEVEINHGVDTPFTMTCGMQSKGWLYNIIDHDLGVISVTSTEIHDGVKDCFPLVDVDNIQVNCSKGSNCSLGYRLNSNGNLNLYLGAPIMSCLKEEVKSEEEKYQVYEILGLTSKGISKFLEKDPSVLDSNWSSGTYWKNLGMFARGDLRYVQSKVDDFLSKTNLVLIRGIHGRLKLVKNKNEEVNFLSDKVNGNLYEFMKRVKRVYNIDSPFFISQEDYEDTPRINVVGEGGVLTRCIAMGEMASEVLFFCLEKAVGKEVVNSIVINDIRIFSSISYMRNKDQTINIYFGFPKRIFNV